MYEKVVFHFSNINLFIFNNNVKKLALFCLIRQIKLNFPKILTESTAHVRVIDFVNNPIKLTPIPLTPLMAVTHLCSQQVDDE